MIKPLSRLSNQQLFRLRDSLKLILDNGTIQSALEELMGRGGFYELTQVQERTLEQIAERSVL